MAIKTTEIRVRFRGEGSGVGELTWGQMRVWRTTQATGLTLNLVQVRRLPPATSVEELASALGFVVGRHPALRTRLRFAGGRTGPRHPLQVVAESDEIPLRVLDIDGSDDADAVAENLRARWVDTPFDLEREFPVRMAVVRQSGILTHLVVGYSHVMVDGAALAVVRHELATGQVTASSGVHPLELARLQAGPVGHRQSARALRYWAEQVERLPVRNSGGGAEPREPRFWEFVQHSPAMELGLRAIAARGQVQTTYVLLAAYAVAAARVLGRSPTVALPVVSNRFRPGLADAISQVSQPGIAVVDVAGATFDQVVDRAWKAVTEASFFGYYDPVDCDRLLDVLADRRGEPLDIWWNYNDRRGMFTTAGGAFPSTAVELRAAISDALPHTERYWAQKFEIFDGALFVSADSFPLLPLPDLPIGKVRDTRLPVVHLRVVFDTHRFALADIEAFAREMEAVVVDAALSAAGNKVLA